MDKQKVVVHIDDDLDDQLFVKHAIHDYDSTITHLPFQEGEKALKYLNLSVDCGRIPLLVLLDINMPGMDGRMLLKELKTNDRLTSIPVVLFNTSSSSLTNYLHKRFLYHWSPNRIRLRKSKGSFKVLLHPLCNSVCLST